MAYHHLKNKQENYVSSELGVHPFFVKEYKNASQNYSMSKLFKIITYLKNYDLKSKGINNKSTNDGELLKELTFKILH